MVLVEEKYAQDGAVDLKGRPVLRSKTGKWKACSFIIVYEIFERLAYQGIAANLVIYLTRELHQGTVKASNNVTNWSGTVWMTPILGAYVADAYLGQFWTFLIGSTIYLLGMILLTLVVSLRALRSSEDSSMKVGMFYLALYIIAIGNGGTKPNISTLGAGQFDEFEPKEKAQKLSFFNWWVFSTFIGFLISETGVVYIQDNVGWSIGYGLPTVGLGISILVFLVGVPFYRHKLPLGSPFTKMAKVILASFSKWKLPLPNDPNDLYELSLEEYTKKGITKIDHTSSLRCLDKAAVDSEIMTTKRPWTLCPITQVEETKKIVKLLPLLLITFIPSIISSQIHTLFIKQGTTLDRRIGHHGFNIPPACLAVFTTIFMLISIVLYDRCFVPIARRYTKNPRGITMLQRFGVGLVLHVVITITACLAERKRLSVAREHGVVGKKEIVPLSVFILLPQFGLMGLADAFLEVSKQEFFYDQAPEGMKSLGASFFTTSKGVGNFLRSSSTSPIATLESHVVARGHDSCLGLDLMQENWIKKRVIIYIMGQVIEGDYTQDGSVDLKGRPVLRSKTGKWRACFFILGYEMFERLAIVGVQANLVLYLTRELHEGTVRASNSVTNWIGTMWLSPLLGAYIADSYLGRYWTSVIASSIILLGMILLTLAVSLHSLRPPSCSNQKLLKEENCPKASFFQVGMFYLSLYIIAIGNGGTRSNISTMGADQFDVFESKEKTQKLSFFNWWMSSILVGVLFSSTFLVYIQDNVGWSLGYGIPTVGLGFSVLVLLFGTKFYRLKLPMGSPLTKMGMVLVATIRKWRVDLPNDPKDLYELSLEDYGNNNVKIIRLDHTPSLRFLDKAAVKTGSTSPWMLSTVTQVEETKQMIKMIPILIVSFIPNTIVAQLLTLFIKQGTTLDRNLGPHFQIPPACLIVLVTISFLLSLVAYDRLFVPIVRRYTKNPRGITMLQRMGIGFAIHVIVMVVATLIERKRLGVARSKGALGKTDIVPLSIFVLLPQFALMGVGDTFMEPSQMEFYYDQAPESMKSLGSSLFCLSKGVGFFLSSFLLSIVSEITKKNGSSGGWVLDNLNVSRMDYYYAFLAVLAFLNFILFVFFAKLFVYNSDHHHHHQLPTLWIMDNVIIMARKVDDDEKGQSDENYTEDGTVDLKGRPLLRSNTGKWTACSFIVGYEVFERMAYYGISTNLVLYLTNKLHEGTVTSSNNVTNWAGTVWMTPILGAYIADAYLGRYTTFLIASAIYLLGMLLLTLTVSVPGLKPPSCGHGIKVEDCKKRASNFQVGIFYCALYIIAIGTGGTKPNISTMGADQFDEYEPKEKMQKLSFFNWWMFSIFFGTLFSNTFLVYIQDNVGWAIGYGLPTIGLAFAILVFLVGTKFYRHKWPSGSPLTKIVMVIVAAIGKWKVTLPTDPKELSMGPNFEIPPACLAAFITIFMLISIVLYDRCFVPIVRRYTQNPRGITLLQRLGIGLILHTIIMVTACLAERKRLSVARENEINDKHQIVPLTIFILLPQFALMGVADSFVETAKLEFFYDQAPLSMKSLGTSYFTSSLGIGNFLSSFVLTTVSDYTKRGGRKGWILDNLNVSHLDYYYAFLAVLSFLNFFFFLYVAKSFVYNVDVTDLKKDLAMEISSKDKTLVLESEATHTGLII
ncbi:hypothetical protein F8388_009486 [Cannabis sativa]|uniref:Uncharacterized protein n=1 Tax=Cannabis sativa TaxID=3483 RepID=A0A7J6EIG0_CANSA|nr:hypothetical protein F8388_009486 [Cannabis sativa]